MPRKVSGDVSSFSQARHHAGHQALREAEEKAMTPKGAQMVIEDLSMRVFQIDEVKARLDQEKEALQARIRELEQIRDADMIQPDPIIQLNGQG